MRRTPLRNPFPGLRAFEPEEDYLFFGREKETDELRRRLRTSRFLAVIGSSGSGKSSLVKSGLIPSLHAGFMSRAGSSWRVAMLRPGEDPIGNLSRALEISEVVPAMSGVATTNETVLKVTLRDSSLGVAEAVRHAMLPTGDNLLVVVDQFEELFRFARSRTVHNSDDEALAFVKLLLDAPRQDYASVYVVITMRSEFIGDCMPFPGLPEAINEGLYLIPRMSRDEMRDAITNPVAVSGSTIAARLVVRLLNEVGSEMDRLPVLQHALMRTWDTWARDHAESEPIDNRHYEAIGTMKEALSQHGEEAYKDLSSERSQTIAERLFKTITDTTEEGRGVRKPASLGRIAAVCEAAEAEVAEVVETFRQPGRAFLQPPHGVALESDSIIDISHESLMRLWDRLAGWTKEEARSTEIYHRLSSSAKRHEAGEESLWRNPQLQIGLRWRKENHPTEAWAGDRLDFARSMQFLDRSHRAHLLRRAALVAAVLFVIAGLAGWLYRQYAINGELKAKLAALLSTRQLTAVEVAEGSREVAELRDKNGKLKTEIASAQEQREALTGRIQARRESNQTVEQEIVTLSKENEEQASKINALQTEAIALSKEQKSLDKLASQLSSQGDVLNRENEVLAKEEEIARTRAARLIEKATWLGYEYSIVSPPFPPGAQAAPSIARDVKAGIFTLPLDIANNDALRQQIEDLQRQLDELRAERAKQVDEAGWLKKENALLEQQRTKLFQEVQNLAQTEKELQQRHQVLQQMAATAKKQNQGFKEEAARMEPVNAEKRKQVEELRTATGQSQQKTFELTHGIGSLRQTIIRKTGEGEEAERFIDGATRDLLQHADRPDVAADLRGLLALAVWRVAPDPETPTIYNALWLALSRLDERAAQEITSSRGRSKGKIGTTTSAALAQAICVRVKRGFTTEEWQRLLPSGAIFEKLSQPCKGQ